MGDFKSINSRKTHRRSFYKNKAVKMDAVHSDVYLKSFKNVARNHYFSILSLDENVFLCVNTKAFYL